MKTLVDAERKEREARRQAVTEAWHGSPDIRAFIATLEKAGFILARDERQSHVIIDCSGDVHSLTRQIEGVKPKEIKAKLEGISGELPDIPIAQDRARQSRSERRSGEQSREERNLIRSLAPYTLLVMAVFLAYANVYRNEFLYDDLLMIVGNKFLTSFDYLGRLLTTNTIQGSGNAGPFYRPLQMLLYLLVYQTAGPSTLAFHLLNVTLHALNACLLYRLGAALRFRPTGALFAALLWALHPINTEAVTWMGCTADPLCLTFLLSGILCLVPEFTHRRVAAACVFFVLALLSKETSVVFPGLVMGLLFYRDENRWSLKTYIRTWPFWLIAVLYVLVRATVLDFSDVFGFYNVTRTANMMIGDHFVTVSFTMTIWDRIYTFLATLPTFLRLLLLPTGLHIERNFPYYVEFWSPQVVAGLALLALACGSIIWRPSRRATPLAWGLLWAATVHVPASGLFIPSGALIFYEHWLYLPTAGLSLAVGETLARLIARVRASQVFLTGLGVLIACLLGIMTFEQNEVWRDPIVFYNHIFASGDDSTRARVNLGAAYEERGQPELALEQYRRVLAMTDNYDKAQYDFARLLFQLNPQPTQVILDEGIKHFQRALEINPNLYQASDALAAIYTDLGDEAKESAYSAQSAAIRKKLGIE